MDSLEPLTNLLKNELSALDTYQQVLAQFKPGETSVAAKLLPIYKGHQEAIASLHIHMSELDAIPAAVADASTVASDTKVFTQQTALVDLLTAEKNTVLNYEKALKSQFLPLSIRCLIEWKLLLIQYSHIRILDRLLDGVAA
jgi:hypothetical protein